MQTLKGFRNILSPVKKALLSLRIRLTEKGHWVWVQWDSMRISNHAGFLLRVYTLRDLITKRSNILNETLPKHLKDLQTNVEKLLISVVVGVGMLISSLLLLTPLLVLFVAGHLLRLSHIVLMFIHTKLYQARTKLRIDT